MAISEAKKRANRKWNDAHKAELYDQIAILCPKGEREIVKAAANAEGVSLSVYIMEAVRWRMQAKRDGAEPMSGADPENPTKSP